MSYAVQCVIDGQYESADPSCYTPDPHRAFRFISRFAAQGYIDRYMLADDHRVATLPDQRALLSQPQPRLPT